MAGRGRERRTTGPVLPGLLISGVIAGAVMALHPGMTGYRFRELADDVGRLTGLREADAGSYAFVSETADGAPVGWSSCQPIRLVVNPAQAPEDWFDVVERSVEIVDEASGFDLVVEGTTDDRQFEDRLTDAERPPPVLIGWAAPEEVPDLAGSTAGIGGSTPARQGARVLFVTGMVVLDAGAYARMDASGDEDTQALILAHELGHVLGLDHVEDRDELMAAEYAGQDGFGPGDRAGFERLRSLPC